MKQLLYFTSVLILFVSPVKSPAQINHFIYLQTENKQPFYLKMGKKILNSTVSGYLIIPKLRDSIYNFSIGFLNTENKEYDFSCSINDKDAGYIIKNFTDQGWGLFNLQTLQVVMSGVKEEDIAQPNKTDAFSNLLSIVVNDPSIKQSTPAVNSDKQESKSLPAAAEVSEAKTEQKTSLEANSKAAPAEEKSPAPAADQVIISNRIIKQDVVSNTEGLHITYVDFVDGRQDTINVVIPSEKEINTNLPKPENSKEQETNLSTGHREVIDTAPVVNKDYNQVSNPASTKKEEDKKFLDIDMSKTTHDNLDSNHAKEAANTSSAASSNAAMINTACKSIASEEDFLKIRKKMASSRTEEEMISVAKKAFKAKCFTTNQIKNLGTLFLNDQGRYNFFESGYPFVSDPQSYKMLENQLIDEYYKSRFKAMIQH